MTIATLSGETAQGREPSDAKEEVSFMRKAMTIGSMAVLLAVVSGISGIAVSDASARIPGVLQFVNPSGSPRCDPNHEGNCWVSPETGATFQCICEWNGLFLDCDWVMIRPPAPRVD